MKNEKREFVMLESKHTAEMAKDHRKRVRERFLKGGVNSFDEYQIMEMILFEFLPRVDTYPVAHRLIDKFGSLAGVISAPVEELTAVDGIGKKTAERLHFLGLMISLTVEKELAAFPFVREENIISYLSWTLRRFPVDSVCIMYLDGKDRLIDRVLCEHGGNGRSLMEEIRIGILANRPKKVVLSHKHPENDLRPSPDDLYVTSSFKELCKELGVTARAHYIISGYKAINAMEKEENNGK